MSNLPNCPFCDKESFKNQIIEETENFYVLHARRPLSWGHCLVIPKQHENAPIGISGDHGNELLKTINIMISAITKANQPTGFNIFMNLGKTAGQEIAHTHFHIVPRYPDEVESPFAVLNDPEKRKLLQPTAPDIMTNNITKIRSFLN